VRWGPNAFTTPKKRAKQRQLAARKSWDGLRWGRGSQNCFFDLSLFSAVAYGRWWYSQYVLYDSFIYCYSGREWAYVGTGRSYSMFIN
jgi:hypothetical protein